MNYFQFLVLILVLLFGSAQATNADQKIDFTRVNADYRNWYKEFNSGVKVLTQKYQIQKTISSDLVANVFKLSLSTQSDLIPYITDLGIRGEICTLEKEKIKPQGCKTLMLPILDHVLDLAKPLGPGAYDAEKDTLVVYMQIPIKNRFSGKKPQLEDTAVQNFPHLLFKMENSRIVLHSISTEFKHVLTDLRRRGLLR